jgi:hypothetical protein
MAKKFLTDINIAAGVYDSSGDIGNSGQVLSSTGSGVNWINATSSASVVYQDGFTGDGSTTAFTLANSIDNENKTQVYIDGVYQHKDTFSLSGTTLTFSTAPPNTTDIEVISFSSVSAADDILYDDDFSSAGLMTTNGSGVYSITTNNSSNWNTAYTYSQVGHLPLAGGAITGAITTNSTFDGRDVSVDGTKLDGIETNATADQTDAEIRTAVEAATDSNVFTDADHTKLNAIEASATADQTAAEIRVLVEAATDSNVFTDADHTKLNAIEASADVTDATNVTAAGALMDSELTDLAGIKAVTISDLATETYVDTAVSDLVDSSPATLNTLNELAAALGDDPNFATTTATSIGTKLPLAGGTLTGFIQLGANQLRFDQSGTRSWAISASGGNLNINSGDSAGNVAISSGLTVADNATFAGTISVTGGISATGYNNSNWNTAYTYSQVGHLPLAGGTISGQLESSYTGTGASLQMYGHAGAANYNYFLNASNDGGVKAVHFVNGSTRTADGGANAYIIRNDGGKFILGTATQATEILGSGGGSANWNTAYGWGNHASGGYAADNAVVKLTGNQSIDGIKTFIGTHLSLNTAANSWKYFRLQSGTSVLWDIGTNENDDSSSLQFRPAGGSTNRVTISQAGVITAPRASINAGAGYPLQTSSSQRYGIQIRNTNNSVNTNYGWWWGTDTNFDMFFHADGASDRFTLTRQGEATAFASMSAPIYYDRNDTSYYLNPASTGTSLNIAGGISTNAANGNVIIKHTVSEANSWLFQENAANWGLFWLNESANGTAFGSYTTVGAEFIGFRNGSNTNFKNPSAWTGIASGAYAGWLLSNYSGYFWTASTQYSETDMRAPIFYDSANTSYYLDPASTSILNRVEINDDLDVRAQVGTWITSDVMGDAIGWNTSYGVYIGSNVGGTHYLRGNGTFTTGGSTYGLWHEGNDSGLLVKGTAIFANAVADDTSGPLNFNRSSGWDEYIIKHGTSKGMFGKKGIGWHMDSANSFHILSSGWTSNFGVEHGGSCRAAGDLRAPIFYDLANTGYYVDPAVGSILKGVQFYTNGSNAAGNQLKVYSTTNHQYPQIYSNGALEAMWNYRNNAAEWYVGLRTTTQLVGTAGFHFYNTTSSQTVGGWTIDGHSHSIGSSRAPIFYDSANTAQFINPGGSISRMLGFLKIGNSSTYNTDDGNWGSRLQVASTVHARIDVAQDANAMRSTWYCHTGHAGSHFGTTTAHHQYLMSHNAVRQTLFNGYSLEAGSYRAPIFYDSANTGYYTRPASSSYINTLHTAGQIQVGASGSSLLYIGGTSGNYFRFHTNNADTYFDMNCGNIHWRQGASTRFYFYTTTANMTINGSLTQNSDIRVKENIVEIPNAIDKVKAIRGVYYNRTDFNTDITKIGVIAQEVEAVLPELILEAPDTGLKSVAYAELTAVLINAIKELEARVQELENN